MTEPPRPAYALSGWRVESEIPLPELAPWEGESREADLRIVLGPVPGTVDDPRIVTTVLQVGNSGQVRFHVKGIAAFLIERGRRITVAPEMPADAPDIRLFLLGTPYGVVCHQRGLVPMHAATIEIDGRAVSLAGPSGVGKSTLAAAFWQRGFRLIADDLTPFELTGSGAVALPGLGRIRLWKDSVERFQWDSGELERCRALLEKFSRPIDTGPAQGLAPLALFNLQRHAVSAGGVRLRPLAGQEAAQWMGRHVYRGGAMVDIGDRTSASLRVLRAAAAIPHHFLMSRPMRYDDLDATVDTIVETVRSAG